MAMFFDREERPGQMRRPTAPRPGSQLPTGLDLPMQSQPAPADQTYKPPAPKTGGGGGGQPTGHDPWARAMKPFSYSQGMQNMMNKFAGTDWGAIPEGAKPLQGIMDQLQQSGEGMDFMRQAFGKMAGISPQDTSQQQYNIARQRMSGQLQAGTAGLRDIMGGQGLMPGESGRADTALGQMYGQGMKGLQQTAGDIAVQQSQMLPQQLMAQAQGMGNIGQGMGTLGTSRLLGAGNIGAQLGGMQQAGQGMGIGAMGAIGGLEQFDPTLALNQGQLWQQRQGQQAAAGAAGANREWGQQMDIMRMLQPYMDANFQEQAYPRY